MPARWAEGSPASARSTGYDTWVFDADPAPSARCGAAIESSWSRAIDKGKLSRPPPPTPRAIGCAIAERLRDAADVDFVIEAVPEALDLKRMVFSELDDLCPDRTVFGSNTSSLPITRIAHATGRRDRVIGIHFFNPVAAMPLVEIVRGRETSPQTEERALALVRSLGKEVVRVVDSPGFATSRLGVALGLEAMRMVEEGVAGAADIDRAMELGYGHRMGPLKTSDLVGLDVRLAIAETPRRGTAVRPFRSRPEILKTLVAEGRTGKKAGEGFFRWEGDKAVAEGARAPRSWRRSDDTARWRSSAGRQSRAWPSCAVGLYLILKRSLHFHGPGADPAR